VEGSLKQRRAVAATRPSRQTSLSDRIGAIAGLGVSILAAERCAIAFQSSGADAGKVVFAPPGNSRWDAVIDAVLAALAHRLGDAAATRGAKSARNASRSIESLETLALSEREINAIAKAAQIDQTIRVAASAFSDGASAVRIVVMMPAARAGSELEASLELIARAVFDEIALATAHASLEFWRTHGAESGRQAVGAKRELSRERAATNQLDDVVAAARRARPCERFACFGQLVAGKAGFDQWIVAVAEGGAFVAAASSSGRKPFDLGEVSALAESFRRRIVIARWRDGSENESEIAQGRRYSEDKIFGGPYVCIPFDVGAIALGSRDARASAADAEAIVVRLAPFVSGWVMERETQRRDALVRQLALRMFTAIDEERARIARDLHDDQAQLLAAAKIALGGRRDAARAIFKQVEEELRRKTRKLRPATLGDASLDDAIEAEFARLKVSGVTATLIHNGAAGKFSRPVQQLCFQIAREALSNVIEHAHANSVQITVEKIDSAACVSISDDGCGISSSNSSGIGLAGVRERLELMGGKLTVHSRPGRTTVRAEIPESA
jgi:signal transduction histidine kinase